MFIEKIKDFKLSKEKIIMPYKEKTALILLTNSDTDIRDIYNNDLMEFKNNYKNIYVPRRLKIIINKNVIRDNDDSIRKEYYNKLREMKCNGILVLPKNNFIYDAFREHKLFYSNIENLNKKQIAENYISLLKMIINSEIFNNYENKLMIIPLDKWINNENNITKLIEFMLYREYDKFISELEDINILIIGKEKYFMFNPQRCSKTSHTEFNRCIKYLDIPDDEYSLLSEDEDMEEPEKPEESPKEEEPQEEPPQEEEISEIIPIEHKPISKRDELLRKRQEEMKIDNIKLNNIYGDSNYDIPINNVSKSVNTLNEEMCNVSFAQMHDTYNNKLYEKDILSIANMLKDRDIPVYIREVKKEDTSDSLNQKITYTFYLEDSMRGRHTLKFDVPKFINGKYMYINGNKKTFNNQRFGKPIIKIKPDTVQIISNYNKIFLRRTGEKVEALFEKFKEYVLSDKKHFKYTLGDCTKLNLAYKTTIEYDTLAKTFSEIIVLGKSDRLHLIFSQPKLKEICSTNGKLKEWEEIQNNENKLCVGYFESGNKINKLYVINNEILDITPTQDSVTKEEYIDYNLKETEEYLDSIIEKYNLNYEEIYVQESIISAISTGIKGLIKGVLSILVKIWNFLVSLVKSVFSFIKSLFSSNKSNKSSNSNSFTFVPQTVNFISFESAKLVETEIDSVKELQDIVIDHITRISQEIKYRSKIQIEATEQMKELIDRKEYVEEKAVINGNTGSETMGKPYSFNGSDIVSSKQLMHPGRFDKKSFSLIKESNNIVEEYNMWIEADIDRIINWNAHININKIGDPDNSLYDEIIKGIIILGQKQGVSNDEIRKYLKKDFYEFPEDEEKLRLLINLRLNYNKRICKLLENMLKINYAILGVTEEDSKEMIKHLRDGDTYTIEKIHKIVDKNRNKFFKEILDKEKRLHYLDFSSIGGGIVYYTNEPLNNLDGILNKIERWYSLALRFDFVIMGHGGIFSNNKEKDEKIELMKKDRYYRSLMNEYNDIVWYEDEDGTMQQKKNLTQEEIIRSEELKEKMLPIEKKAGIVMWGIQPIKTRHFPLTNNINTLIRNCIEEGKMEGKEKIKIFVLSCNPGHFDIDDDLRNRKDVLVVHGKNSMLSD